MKLIWNMVEDVTKIMIAFISHVGNVGGERKVNKFLSLSTAVTQSQSYSRIFIY